MAEDRRTLDYSSEQARSPQPSRRDMLASGIRIGAIVLGGSAAGYMIGAHRQSETVWQIDTDKCINCTDKFPNQCTRCATSCVLNPSAVKCVQNYELCGYCELCTGYFIPKYKRLDEAAENQLCPTNAIVRRLVEQNFYNYDIDNKLCIGCAKCVKGCTMYGNGSFFLQIDQSICVGCNDCSIAKVCPAQAISRVPIAQAYKLKMKLRTSG